MSLLSFIHGSILDIAAEKVREFVRRYNPPRIYVFFSAGKDSAAALAALAYAGESIARRAVIIYNELVGNTHRLNIETAYRIIEKLGFGEPVVVESPPYSNVASAASREGVRAIHIRARNRYGEDFWASVERWGIPVHLKTGQRWCYNEFKEKHWRNLPPVTGNVRYVIVGVKATDSRWRHVRWREADVKTWSRSFTVRRGGIIDIQMSPVLRLTDEEVWMLLREAGLEKELKTYMIYADSLNYVFCPFRPPAKQRRIVELLARHGEREILERARTALERLVARKPGTLSERKAREWLGYINAALGGHGALTV